MAASLKRIKPDGATLDLWRLAETGDIVELARILPRVTNVNARNQHGMTALMRAAYHGHARTVRALLDHGADPNLTRNDKFTALALAAFFGHTETVKILIEHGAKKEVVTRCGASAKTWATARTYATIACLSACEKFRPSRRAAVRNCSTSSGATLARMSVLLTGAVGMGVATVGEHARPGGRHGHAAGPPAAAATSP